MEDLGSIPGSGGSPEKGMATHSSILAWRISWTEEPGAKSQTQLSDEHTFHVMGMTPRYKGLPEHLVGD